MRGLKHQGFPLRLSLIANQLEFAIMSGFIDKNLATFWHVHDKTPMYVDDNNNKNLMSFLTRTRTAHR